MKKYFGFVAAGGERRVYVSDEETFEPLLPAHDLWRFGNGGFFWGPGNLDGCRQLAMALIADAVGSSHIASQFFEYLAAELSTELSDTISTSELTVCQFVLYVSEIGNVLDDEPVVSAKKGGCRASK